MLSTQTIEELRQIVREEYGQDLSYEESEILAKGIVSHFDLLAQIHHRSRHTTSIQEVISESSEIKLAPNTSRAQI